MRQAKIALLLAAFCASFGAAAASAAPLKVVTTVPDLAEAVRAIGGARVEVTSLLAASASPHALQVVPELTRKIAEAQVLCSVGLDLEAGYLPALVRRSGNPLVQRGGKGQCEASRTVHVLGAPATPVDFAMGDVHPYGNPHFWLSPKALGDAGTEIAAALGRVDPAHAPDYQRGLASWRHGLGALSSKAAAILAPVVAAQRAAGHPLVMQYHEEFTYLLDQYGLTSFGSLEAKPGAGPSAARLARLADDAKRAGVKALLAATYDPPATLARFHDRSGLPVVVVPTMVDGTGRYPTYAELHLHIVSALAAAVMGGAPPLRD